MMLVGEKSPSAAVAAQQGGGAGVGCYGAGSEEDDVAFFRGLGQGYAGGAEKTCEGEGGGTEVGGVE